uniref:Uncharacterized protein n=1 Tax=Panagrolaimus sp. JU765 TaxID=591449 RepID=A0AC34RI96_9BILA
MLRKKDASTRLIKPTLPEIHVDQVVDLVENWQAEWEYNGEIQIYDEGIAQYLLIGPESHNKFFASLILGKPSLRCTLNPEEPVDLLEEKAGNTFQLIYGRPLSQQAEKDIDYLIQILTKRGYHFEKI